MFVNFCDEGFNSFLDEAIANASTSDEKNDLDSLNEFLKVMKDPYKTFPRIEKFQSTPSTKKETYVTYCGT